MVLRLARVVRPHELDCAVVRLASKNEARLDGRHMVHSVFRALPSADRGARSATNLMTATLADALERSGNVLNPVAVPFAFRFESIQIRVQGTSLVSS